jgi:hypothetical protein
LRANKSSAPHINESELTNKLTTVLRDPAFAANAQQLAARVTGTGGRAGAAGFIVEIAKGKVTPEAAMLEDLTIDARESAFETSEVSNEKGRKLITATSPPPWRFL